MPSTSRTFATVAETADSSSNAAPVMRATIRASVVLPLPGRTVEDHRADAVLLDREPERRALAEHVPLADELVERRRAHAQRERRDGRSALACRVGKEVAHTNESMLRTGMETAVGVSNISVVYLYVRDMERSLTFYRDLLGIPLEGDGHWVEATFPGGTRFALHAAPDGKDDLSSGTVSVSLEVEDVDRASELLRARRRGGARDDARGLGHGGRCGRPRRLHDHALPAAGLMATEAEDYSQPILPGEGASDYERYLRTDDLLALQKTPEEMAHRDELLFQTVHQSSELWLKLACFEVETATQQLRAHDVAGGAASAPARERLPEDRDAAARHARAHVAVGVPDDPRDPRPRQRLRLARASATSGASRRRSARRSTRCGTSRISRSSTSTCAAASSRSCTSSPRR